MKQFNLEEYLKNPSRKVITRDGRKVRKILCTDRRGSDYPVIALVEFGWAEDPIGYTKDGKHKDWALANFCLSLFLVEIIFALSLVCYYS